MRSVRMDHGGPLPAWVAVGAEIAQPTSMDERSQVVMASLVEGGCILVQKTSPKYSGPWTKGACSSRAPSTNEAAGILHQRPWLILTRSSRGRPVASRKTPLPQAQVFIVVNDSSAVDFLDLVYAGNKVNGLHQAKALPTNTGSPVVFLGSTTGPKYSEQKCSPFQVTWSVRPQCAKVDINSLSNWCDGNVFKENRAHGVRKLVTNPQLLSEIE